MKHIPETKIEKTGELSRRSDWRVEVENDNNNQTLIKDQWIYSLTEVIIEGLEVEILEKIKVAKGKNKEVVKVVEEMKDVGVKVLWENKWQIKKYLILKEGNIAKRWGVKSRDNLVVLWCTSSRT